MGGGLAKGQKIGIKYIYTSDRKHDSSTSTHLKKKRLVKKEKGIRKRKVTV
jgi:hypothetical protein